MSASFRNPLAEKSDTITLTEIIRPYGVGIDTHSKFIAVCVLIKQDGDVVRFEKNFPTAWASMLAARDWVLTKLPTVLAHLLEYCIESTGCYHMPVLQAFGGVPSVVNPMLAGATHRKTDKLDARMLAQQAMTGMWRRSFLARPEAQVLRVLWAARTEANRCFTRTFNRVNNILLRFGHTFGADSPCSSPEGLAIIDAICAGEIVNVPGAKPEILEPSVRDMLSKLVSEGEDFRGRAKSCFKAAVAYVERQTWPCGGEPISGELLLDNLRTVPGVGPVTAMNWLCEITDPGRFASAKEMAAFCGCDPSLKVSAGKVTQHVRRKGNMKIHQALVQAAVAVIARSSDALGKWGAQIAAKHSKGGFRKAAGAVARRIAVGLWHVHLKSEPFSLSGYNFHRVPAADALASSAPAAAHGGPEPTTQKGENLQSNESIDINTTTGRRTAKRSDKTSRRPRPHRDSNLKAAALSVQQERG